MKRLLLALIRGYRKYISPARPPCCRFIPTCSAYPLGAVEKYGAWKGGLLALRRILKCQSFHKQKSIDNEPRPSHTPRRANVTWTPPTAYNPPPLLHPALGCS